MIHVELSRLVINERSDEQLVFLREEGGLRQLPIVIGMFEAFAIDRLLKGEESERPLTHDLLASLLRALGAELERVKIDHLEDDTYYAKLILVKDTGVEQSLDARPSDAITLALKQGAPIYVSESVFEAASDGVPE